MIFGRQKKSICQQCTMLSQCPQNSKNKIPIPKKQSKGTTATSPTLSSPSKQPKQPSQTCASHKDPSQEIQDIRPPHNAIPRIRHHHHPPPLNPPRQRAPPARNIRKFQTPTETSLHQLPCTRRGRQLDPSEEGETRQRRQKRIIREKGEKEREGRASNLDCEGDSGWWW